MKSMRLPSEFYTLVNNIWPILFIFIVSLIAIRISYIIERKEKFVFYKEFFDLVFIVYILLLFELVTNNDVQSYSNNFIPFREILRYDITSGYFIWNVVGNILIFLPFGFAVSLYIKPEKMNKPLFIGIITSLTIECVQMFIGRSFDIDDIILNVIGGILGYLLYKFLSSIRDHLPSVLRSEMCYNILTIILIIIFGIYLYQYWGVIFA